MSSCRQVKYGLHRTSVMYSIGAESSGRIPMPIRSATIDFEV